MNGSLPITCSRSFEIDAGHRLQKHESKCRNVHGHRYKFDITVRADSLDECGRIIDFGCLKSIIGAWLEQELDHAFIAENTDPIIDWLVQNEQKYFSVNFPPTAENLARFLFSMAVGMLPKELTVTEITCWETPSCRATVTRNTE